MYRKLHNADGFSVVESLLAKSASPIVSSGSQG